MRGEVGCRARERKGERIHGRARLRRALAFSALLLLTAAPAVADERPLPWAGGAAVESDLETYAGKLASELAKRPVRVICNGATDWSQLAAQQRFDPVTVWGYVLFAYDSANETYKPLDYMHLSEQACWFLDQYWSAKPEAKGKICRVATRIDFKTTQVKVQLVRRVKVNGRWVEKVVTVTKTREVPVEIPQLGTCPDYMNRVFSMQALGHEAMHLAGLSEEAEAECQGMQRIPWIAQRLGATREQARQMAGDYYRDFYLVKRPGTLYYLPGCPNPAG